MSKKPIILAVSLSILAISVLAYAATQTWDFSISAPYTYDTTKIEVDGGVAKLKEMDQTHATTDEFAAGTADQVSTSGNSVKLETYTVAAITPDATCKMLLHMEEAAGTALDSSGNGNDATLTNGPTWTDSGKIDKGISFDGTNDTLNVIDSDSLDITSAITVELWVKPTVALVSGITLLHKCAADGTGWLKIGVEGGQYNATFSLTERAGVRVTGISNAPVNTWTHLAFTYDSTTGIASFYENGYLADKLGGLSGTIPVNNNNLQIGGESNNAGRYFTGLIDEIALWSTALTPEKIAEHAGAYKASGSLESASLDAEGSGSQWTSITWTEGIGYQDAPTWEEAGATVGALWHLDSNLNDDSGLSNNLTSLPSGTGPTTYASAKFSNGMQFDGIDDYLQKADNDSLDASSAVSLSAWVKPTSTDGSVRGQGGKLIDKAGAYTLALMGKKAGFYLKRLETVLSDEAVNDVFFYDTTRDTIAGDWRSDSSKSWYTETLNTATRGATQAFPEKALIVATDTHVYIFDAGDLGLWMRFDAAGNSEHRVWQTSAQAHSVFALNGKLYVVVVRMIYPNGNTGVAVYDFVSDTRYKYGHYRGYETERTIASRNVTGTDLDMSLLWSFPTYERIYVHAQAINGKNYLAMGIVDYLAVVNDTDKTGYKYSDNAGDKYTHVYLTSKGNLYAYNLGQNQLERWDHVHTDSANEENGTPDRVWNTSSTPALKEILGTELITNGGFDTDLTGWDLTPGSEGGTITFDSNTIKFKPGATAVSMYASQSITTTAGKTYKLVIGLMPSYYANRKIMIGSTQNGGEIYTSESFPNEDGKTIYFVATDTTTWINLMEASSGISWSKWDDISVKEVVNPNGPRFPINELIVLESASSDGSDRIIMSTANGIIILDDASTQSNGSIRYVTKDYITEEMIGDIRGMWTFHEAAAGNIVDGATITDASGKGTDLTSVGGATAVSGVRGKALSFNGTTQYLKQKTYATQEGTVRISTANGQAFLWDDGQDFSPYVAQDGNNPYMVVVKDAENDVAWGYCGAAPPATGPEMLTDGGMENWTSDTNLTSWEKGSATSIVKEATDKQEGSYSCKFTGGGTLSNSYTDWLYQNVFERSDEGGGFIVTFKAKRLTGSGNLQVGSNYTQWASVTNGGLWQSYTTSGIAILSGSGSRALTFAAVSGEQWLIDDVSLKRTSELLGSELVTNGDFTTDTTNWGIEHGSIASVTGGQSGNCLEVTRIDYGYQYAYQNLTVAAGKLYKFLGYVKSGTSGNQGFQVAMYDTVTTSIIKVLSGTTSDSWIQVSGYFVSGSNSARIYVKKNSLTDGTMLFDGVSVREVLSPPVNQGITLYSTKTETTQNLAGLAAEFGPNDTLTYEVRKSDFQITGAMTVGAWVKPNGADMEAYIIAKRDSIEKAGFGLMWDGTIDKIWWLYGAPAGWLSSNAVFTEDNTWVFFVATNDGNGNITFYKNGIVQGTASGATQPQGYSDLRIGARTGMQGDFSGSIDSPFITATALTASQIKTMYLRGKAALDKSHNTDDTRNQLGGTTNDIRAIYVNNDTLLAGDSEGGISFIDLATDTRTDYLTPTETGSAAITSISGQDPFRFVYGNANTSGVSASGRRAAVFNNLITNNWQHLTGTYDGANLNIYQNGSLFDTVPTTGVITNTTTHLKLGKGFTGIIDEPAIYPRALSATEVLEAYKKGTGNLKLQVRSGSANPPTSEFSSDLTSPDNGDFSALTGRYFQYKAILSTEDPRYSPTFSSITASPSHYKGAYIENYSNLPLSYPTGFTEILGGGNAGTIKYQVSPNNGTNWYYLSGSTWTEATKGNYSQCSPATDINSNLATYDDTFGVPTQFKFLAYLYPGTDGASQCELDNLAMAYNYNYLSFSAPTTEEYLNIGSTRTISWTSGGTVSDNCKIFLKTSLDSDWRTTPIADGRQHQGTFNWTIPDLDFAQTVKAWLKIEDQNNTTAYGISPMFYIRPLKITLSQPAAGNIWRTGSARDIIWTADSGVGDNVKIEYSTNDFNTSQVIVASTATKTTAIANTNGGTISGTYLIPVTIDNSGSGTAYTDPVIKISLTSDNIGFWSHCKSDGGDIRFFDEDGVSGLNYYLQSFNYAGQTATIYVKVPVVPASTAKTVWLNYGDNTRITLSDSSIIQESGLMGYWEFEEGSGTMTVDTSGNGNTGTLINGPTWIANGKVGKCLSLDGTNDYVSCGKLPNINVAESYSLSLWANLTRIGNPNSNCGDGRATLIAKKESYYGPTLNVYGSTSKASFVHSYEDHSSTKNVSYPSEVILNKWMFFTIVYNKALSRISLYLDGNLVANTDTTGISFEPALNGALRIGFGDANCSNTYSQGLIDSVRIYNRPLSDSEIATHYASGNAGLPAYISHLSSSTTLSPEQTSFGTYRWVVPNLESSTVKLRVSDAVAPTVYGTSGLFALAAPLLTLTTPNGGENWVSGQVEDIIWQNNGALSTALRLEYSKDNFVNPANTIWVADIPGYWGYGHKKAITITNSSEQDLTDYQILITLTADNFDYSQVRTDGGDLRFTSGSGTPLDFWCETWNYNGISKYWVEVNALPESANSTVYVWYGDAASSSGSGFDETMTKSADDAAAHFSLDEGTGTTASGGAATATLTGATWLSNLDGGHWKDRTDIKFSTGSHLSFDGTGDSATITTDLSLTIWGIDCWYKPTQVTGEEVILYKGEDANVNYYLLRKEGDLVGGYTDASGVRHSLESTTAALVADTWYHVGFTRDSSGVMKLYKNGVQLVTATNAVAPITGATGSFLAGGGKNVYDLDSSIPSGLTNEKAITCASTNKLGYPLGTQIDNQDYSHFSGNQGTIKFWVKATWFPGDSTQHHLLLSNMETAEQNKLSLYVANTNQLKFVLTDAQQVEHVATRDISTWGAGTWHHVVASWKGTGVELFVDGE
ncbi:MAG: DUF2341 domain-containing protein [bacterium]